MFSQSVSSEECLKLTTPELRKELQRLNIPGRSRLTTKNAICDAIVDYYRSNIQQSSNLQQISNDQQSLNLQQISNLQQASNAQQALNAQQIATLEYERLPEDLIYESMRHMTYVQLKNLCTSSKKIERICQSERFRKLSKLKYYIYLTGKRNTEFSYSLGPNSGSIYITLTPLLSEDYRVRIAQTSMDIPEQLKWVLNVKNRDLTRAEMENFVERLINFGFVFSSEINPIKRRQIKPITFEQSGIFN